jgi:GntP family gluconate:H+ symporter
VTILLPVVMMLGRTVAKLALTKDTLLYDTLDFVGEPLVALALTVLFAIVMLGWSRGMARDRVGGILRKSLPPIAALLLTIGAGGGLKQMLVNAGISATIGKIAVGTATHNSLLALAIGAGSVFFCHVNDAGFWMVREYFGLNLKRTVAVWSVLQTIVSVVGLVLTLVLWSVLT